MDKQIENTMSKSPEEKTYKRPSWVKKGVMSEGDLCSDCFRVVGVKSRYKLVRLLGKAEEGATVNTLTKKLGLKQPTVTHHLNVLKSIDAVTAVERGRERIYALKRNAHCFEECRIPF
ncbi:helix-turn-helix domain-containing protein [Candidatus Pacebacteria bacterium]|nr:helix-turn-helix domain-containing protein [Candidatus Paceibacterota bacterium]